MHFIVMEITLLIMENHGKIMELCFLISVGTLSYTQSRDPTMPILGRWLDMAYLPKGESCRPYFLKSQCLARILQHVGSVSL